MDTQTKEMYKDLLNAQREIEGVAKDATNPFFKSGYATLEATINACKDILNKNNIIVLQPIKSDTEGVYVCTTLIHTSGEKLESCMRITTAKPNDPQAQGSAISYARRYALQSMLCMSATGDDGESATNRQAKPSVSNDTSPDINGRCAECGAPEGKPHATTCKYHN